MTRRKLPPLAFAAALVLALGGIAFATGGAIYFGGFVADQGSVAPLGGGSVALTNGTCPYTLTATDYAPLSIVFSGAITSPCTVTIPTPIGESKILTNSTAQALTITNGTSSVSLAAAQTALVNVYDGTHLALVGGGLSGVDAGGLITMTRDVSCVSQPGGYCDASVVSASGQGSTDNGASGTNFPVPAEITLAGDASYAEPVSVAHVSIPAVGAWTTVYGPWVPPSGAARQCTIGVDLWDMGGLSDGGIGADGAAPGTIQTKNQAHCSLCFGVDQAGGPQELTACGGVPAFVTDGGVTLSCVPSSSCAGCTTTGDASGCACGTSFAPLAQGLLSDGGVLVQLELPAASVASSPWTGSVSASCNGGP